MENHRPNECKWCGAGQLRSATKNLLFDCFTVYQVDDNQWRRDTVCLKRSANQVLELCDRIQRALETLKTATRFELVRDEYGSYMKGRDSYGNWMDVIEVERAMKILEEKSDGQAE